MGKLFTNGPGSEGRNGRRLKATFLLGLMAFVLVSTTLFEAKPAKAQYTDPITSIQTTTTNVWTTIKDAFVEAAVTAVVNGVNYFTSQLAYTLAVALTSDCPGQVVCWNSKAFEDGFKQAWQGAIGEAVGTLSQQGGFSKLGFDLCNPSIKFALKIQLGALDEIKPPAPKCDFNALVNNWDNFKDSVSSGEVLKGLKPTFEKGQSGLSIALGAQSGLYEVKEEAKRADIMKRIMDASAGGGFSGVRDPVSGRAKAPASVTHDEFQRMRKMQQDNPQQYSASYAAGQIASKAVISIVVNAVQTFAMTLISRLLNKLINGLMSTEELIALQPDLILNPEGLLQPPGETGVTEALAPRFSAAQPKDAGTTDPLLDFSVCPGSSRSPNNCVIDQQFANAVRVADVTPVTIKEAIDKNMLHGDWPLIPDTDQVKDQDPFCYTYAYCESNIKKLRAARIIPIGWEIAAHKAGSSTRLRDVVNAFNDCSPTGTIDGSHPWCHLIDPDWVLKIPPTQCRALAFGAVPVSSEIPSRTEQCVDTQTCLKQDDNGTCVGGWGYCARERNVWRFNGDSCPAAYNTCRTLKSRTGDIRNYLLNTIDHGVCNADNAGCRQYGLALSTVSCSLSSQCTHPTDANDPLKSCPCTVNLASCNILRNQTSCTATDGTVCRQPYPCSSASCSCTTSLTCDVQKGQLSCSSLTGGASTGDDWQLEPSRFFNKNAQSCSASDNGCSALVKLDAGQSLNLVKNGSFEQSEDGDNDGSPDHAKFWTPFGDQTSGTAGYVRKDGARATSGANAVLLPTTVSTAVCTVAAGPNVDTNGNCSADLGCPCTITAAGALQNYTCKVIKGHKKCSVTNGVTQDGLPVTKRTTYTLSATFVPDSGNAVNGKMTLSFRDANGAGVSLASTDTVSTIDVTGGTASTQTCAVSGGNLVFTIDGTKDDLSKGLTAACTFVVDHKDILHAAVSVMATSGTMYADDIQLEEGGGSPFHDGYGAADMTPVDLKVPPAFLGCTGDASDRPECAAFAGVCRESEVGCDGYTPDNGDPTIPGIAGPQDRCPQECAGYDVFKQEESDFDAVKFPVYFIPETATQCTENDAGCSQFTSVETEKVEYYSRLRLCVKPDDPSVGTYYSWEGSDTTGYQLRVWSLKNTMAAATVTPVAGGTLNDVCADPACVNAGPAPCTSLDANAENCDSKTLANPAGDATGLCTRADIDSGNFDCREFYDATGNRHYRILSKTIIASGSCTQYRITVSTQADCNKSNGRWDVGKGQCIYFADASQSRVCSAAQNNCRAYKGNASTNIHSLFVDDFESGISNWNDSTDAGIANLQQSGESVTVGGHSLKIGGTGTGRDARREVGGLVGPGRSYTLTFWARGTGTVNAGFRDGSIDLICTNSTTCTSTDGCGCTTQTGLACLVANGSTSCTIPKVGKCLGGTNAGAACVSGSTCTGGTCSINPTPAPAKPRSLEFSDDDESAAAPRTSAPRIALTSEWKQYSLGPVIVEAPTDPTLTPWGHVSVKLQLEATGVCVGGSTPGASCTAACAGGGTCSQSDIFIDNVNLKEVQDSIFVVRDSWATPVSCDTTPDGIPSPQEMLGCRKYLKTSDNTAAYLKSFTNICREKAIGCAAFSSTQNTSENPYEESFNAVCRLYAADGTPRKCGFQKCSLGTSCSTPGGCTCTIPGGGSSCLVPNNGSSCDAPVPADAGAACVCDYDLRSTAASTSAPQYLSDVCRAAIGESDCRFKLDRWDDSTRPDEHPDRVNVPADKRLYLVGSTSAQCSAEAVGCRAMGQPHMSFEDACNLPTSGTGIVNGTCMDVDGCTCGPINGSTCKVTQGEKSCKVSFELGIVDKWNALALKDDPSKYDQTLCSTKTLNCEEYTASDGTYYFRNPDDKVCEYKVDANVNGQKVSGFFRRSSTGSLFPCYPELLEQGDFYAMYKNADPKCTLPNITTSAPYTSTSPHIEQGRCKDPGGCLCFIAPNPIAVCRVYYGNTTCGYQGWVGQCEAKYDRCEEFIDPVATSASHPAGEPYYYIVNTKLDLKSCAGKASLKSGCVLFKQTSKTQNLYSSAASYFRSVYEAQSGIVPPVNCDVNPRSAYCEQRCFSIPEGVCDQTPDKFCKNDTEDPDLGCPGADNHCTGRKRWGNGCNVANGDKDCNQALGERCATTAHCSVTTTTLCDVNGDCPSGETCSIPGSGLHLGKADAATVTANDANLIIKVRPDRECAQWFTCSSFNTVYDSQQNKVRPICSAFTLCDQTRNETATPYECTHVVEPAKKVFTDVDYSKRDTTFAGLEYSGFSIPARYPAQYLSPYSIVQGLCVDHSGVDKLPVTFCTDSKVCTDAGAADDYCKKLSGVCVGDHLGQSCDAHDVNVGCGSGYCASSYFATTRFGILLDQSYACKTDADCDGNDEDGSNCNPAHGDADCRSATNRVAKCISFPDGAHKCSPTGQVDDGACIEHKCYYGYGGGKADVHDNTNDAQCRAYPEPDSPYGESVVDNQTGVENRGYDAMTFQAVAKKTEFKGTNVCSFNNDCECSYQRYQYGKGASIVRFYGYNGGAFKEDWAGGVVQPTPELNVGVCSGGSLDGYTCRPNASPNDCMVSSDDSGTCQRLSTVAVLNGWTGFCMDPDKSILINGDQNQYNCNVWLPVDQLAGAPDNFNQFVEAGYNPAASSLLYCASAGGATSGFDSQIWSESGNFHPASPCQSKLNAGCAGMAQPQCNAARNNVSTPFADMTLNNTPACHWTGSSCVDNVQFQDGATFTDPNPSNNPFSGTVYDFFWSFVVNPDGPKYYSACELAAFHASVTSCTLSTLAGIVIAGVTMGAAAAGSGPAACLYVLGFWCNQTTTCQANGGIAAGNTHLFDTSWQDATATNHVIGGSIYENQLIGLRIEFPQESEAGGAVKGRMYLYPGRWQASYMFDDNDSLGTAAGPGGGDRVNGKAIGDYAGDNPCVRILNGNPNGGNEHDCESIEDDGLNNCIGAQAVFDATSHKLTGIKTVLCHNASTFSHYIPANVFAMYRQSCYDVVQTHDSSRLVPNIAWTDRLWKASPAGGDGGAGAMTFSGGAAAFTYTHHTDRPGPVGYPADLTPFGPVNLVGPTVFSGISTLDARWPIPVYSSEGGSPYTNIRREGPDLWTRCGTPDPNGMNTVNCPNGYQHVGSDPGINSGNDFPSPDAYGNSKPTAAGYPYAFGNAQAGMDQLSKMFVKSFAYWKFDPTTNKTLTPPVYIGQGTNPGYDRRTTFMNDNNAPRIVGVNTNDCANSNDALCRELPYPGCGPGGCGSLTVEFPEPDGAHIDGDLPGTPPTGRLTVKLKYYAYADKDHMALRRHIVDFGDGTPVVDTSGYFKNHRGCDNSTVGNCDDTHSICAHGTDWGVQPQACEPRYFQDTHTYTCNPQLIENLPDCDGTGHPYPCRSGDTCEFKPRVQFLDNWGMCNGYCPGGDGSGNFCFNGQGGDGDDSLNLAGFSYAGDIGNPTKVSTTFPRNECQDLTNRNYLIQDNASHQLIPWTAFGGTIRVKS